MVSRKYGERKKISGQVKFVSTRKGKNIWQISLSGGNSASEILSPKNVGDGDDDTVYQCIERGKIFKRWSLTFIDREVDSFCHGSNSCLAPVFLGTIFQLYQPFGR